jgi:hypothetical protein
MQDVQYQKRSFFVQIDVRGRTMNGIPSTSKIPGAKTTRRRRNDFRNAEGGAVQVSKSTDFYWGVTQFRCQPACLRRLRSASKLCLFSLRKYFLRFVYNFRGITLMLRGNHRRCRVTRLCQQYPQRLSPVKQNIVVGSYSRVSHDDVSSRSALSVDVRNVVSREENKSDISFNVRAERHQHSRMNASLHSCIEDLPSSGVNRCAYVACV